MLFLKYLTFFSILYSVLIGSSSKTVAETLKVDREFALEREIKVEVTQIGIVIDFNSVISSVNLSHMGQIMFRGFDGVLCKVPGQCPPDSAPSMLIVRLIPEIKFKNQIPSVDGTSMLFVNTDSGFYRISFTPVSKNPKFTKVEIDNKPLTPLFNAKKY